MVRERCLSGMEESLSFHLERAVVSHAHQLHIGVPATLGELAVTRAATHQRRASVPVVGVRILKT